MFGFGRKKPFTRDAFDEAVETVDERIADSDYVGASQAARALAESVEKNNGARTLFWGEAKFLQARVALALGDPKRALEHLRAACEIEGDDDEIVRARLTYEMNLGDALSELGEFDEAESVHRRGLEARRTFYGADHPGFGYGAESLGTVLLRKGEFAEAAGLARQAVEAFRGGERHKLASTLLLWMLAEKAKDPSNDVLGQLSDADRDVFLDTVPNAPGYLFVDATVDLRWEALEHLDDRDARIDCLATIANYSEALDRREERIRALQEYVAIAADASPDEHAFALQGLGLALDQYGRDEEAREAYALALEVADEQRAQVLRNYALYLGEQGEDEPAEAMLREAVDISSGTEHARICGALGVFLHHRQHYDEAVTYLQQCVDELPAEHPDRLTATAHLQYARDGEPCQCGVGMPVALSVFVQEVLLEYIPEDLLHGVIVDENFDISIEIAREPTDEEAKLLESATNEARRRIREQVSPLATNA